MSVVHSASYSCTLCGVVCTSVPDLQLHQAGRKHQKRIAAISASSTASASCASVAAAPVPDRPTSTSAADERLAGGAASSTACVPSSAGQRPRPKKGKRQASGHKAKGQDERLLERQREQPHTLRQEPMGTLVDFHRIILSVARQAGELPQTHTPEAFLQLMADTSSSCCRLLTSLSDSDRLAEALVDAVMTAVTGAETVMFSLVQHCELQLYKLSKEGDATAALVLPAFRQQVRQQVARAYGDVWTEDGLQRPRLCAFIARLFLADWIPFDGVHAVLTERITDAAEATDVACVLQVFRVLAPPSQVPDGRVRPETAPHLQELQRLFAALVRCPAAVKFASHNVMPMEPTAGASSGAASSSSSSTSAPIAAATRVKKGAAASAARKRAAAATISWETSKAILLHQLRQHWIKH